MDLKGRNQHEYKRLETSKRTSQFDIYWIFTASVVIGRSLGLCRRLQANTPTINKYLIKKVNALTKRKIHEPITVEG